MWPFRKRCSALTALDIQPNGIKLIHVEKNKHNFVIKSHLALPFAEPIFVDGKIKYWDRLAALLQQVIHAQQLKGTAAIQLPIHLAHIQHFALPTGLNAAEIMHEIQLQLQKDLPGNQDSFYIDYQICQQTELSQDVIFAATRKKYLMHYQQCIKQAGLAARWADVDIFAINRGALAILQKNLPNKTLQLPGNSYILLSLQEATGMLACFSRQILLHHDGWQYTSQENLIATLKQKLTTVKANFNMHNINDIIICGDKKIQDTIKAITMTWPTQQYYPQLFPDQPLEDFTCAFGLALTEVNE